MRPRARPRGMMVTLWSGSACSSKAAMSAWPLVESRVLLLLVRHDERLPLRAHQDLVLGEVEVGHVHFLLVGAGGGERGLVHEVGEVGAGESRRAAGHDRKVHVVRHRDGLGVHLQDALAALHVRAIHDDAAVEAAGAEERGVEDVGPVRGGDQDDAVVALEAVHLDEEGVQRLLALVVSAAEARAAVAADGVDLVDEDDAGGVLLALFEEIAHAARADAHEHLHEVRARDGEERHVRFTGHRAGEQRLSRARGAHEKDALRDLSAQLLELGGLLQEVDDLRQLVLGFLAARHVLERGFLLVRREQLRAGLSERHRPVPARLHLPHDEDPQADQEQDRRPLQDDDEERAFARLFGRDLDVSLQQVGREVVVDGRVGADARLASLGRALLEAADLLPADGDAVEVALLHHLQELAEGDGRRRGLAVVHDLEEQQDDHQDDHPEKNVLDGCVHVFAPFLGTLTGARRVQASRAARSAVDSNGGSPSVRTCAMKGKFPPSL